MRPDLRRRLPFVLNTDILDELDSLIGSGRHFSLIKNDTAALTGILEGELFGLPHDIWVKRFNYGGFLSHIYQIVSVSKAGHIWRVNRSLHDKSLPVPEPLAFVGPTFRKKRSYFLTVAVAGAENLGAIHKKGNFREPQKIARKLARTLVEWHLSGAIHGDLKWSNIILRREGENDRFLFVDLDRAKLYSFPNLKGMRKDLVRFYRYGLELGAQNWVDSDFFPEYLAGLTPELRKEISPDSIREQALRDWEKKGRRKY